MSPLARAKVLAREAPKLSKQFQLRSKRYLLSRAPLPSSIREVMLKRHGKPIRIVFVCEAGMWNSPTIANNFKSFLDKIQVDHRRIFSIGFDSASLEKSSTKLGRTDYFVQTLPGLMDSLKKQKPKLFEKLKTSGAGIIFPDKMAARVGQNGELEYFDLLKEIIEREKIKH